MTCGLVPPHSSGSETGKKTQKAYNRYARETSLVSRGQSKQDPGLGDEPSCPYQFHGKESRANQPGFVVFWPAIFRLFPAFRRWPVFLIPHGLLLVGSDVYLSVGI